MDSAGSIPPARFDLGSGAVCARALAIGKDRWIERKEPATPGREDAGSNRPVSQFRKGTNERPQAYQGSTMKLPISPTRANANERKRSALVGVQLSKRQAEEAEAKHLAARLRLRDALAAARDEGITVRELASELGVSRNAIYKAMDRLARAERER